MSTKTGTISKFDNIKWLVVISLLASSMFGFYYFNEQYSLLIRVISLLIIIGLATFVALTTDKGIRTKNFIQQTNIEVRKVVWPTRQETVQMTGIVILMVILVTVIIWVMDSILMWLVRFFTGQGA
ncbi:MAG: preprotein translocase subunit SecE [Thiomargarita sp.]|nr:preprotein translocase subunit SecE [Thiomargarita sp.]